MTEQQITGPLRPTGYLRPVGWATSCQITTHHAPEPLRYVWHHILPQACGGATVADNLAELCDSCHYAVHALLHDLKVNAGAFTIASAKRNRRRAAMALLGYQRAVAAGTVDQIPNEGE